MSPRTMTADETRQRPCEGCRGKGIKDGSVSRCRECHGTGWRAPTPPDAGGTAMTDERLAEIREEIRGTMFISPRTVQELMREVTRLRTEATRPNAEAWPDGLRVNEVVEVKCDDSSPDDASWLRVLVAGDGDVHVAMQKWDDFKDEASMPTPHPSIRVRTYAGGGRNLRTRMALLHLMRAMQLDNDDRKAGRRP